MKAYIFPGQGAQFKGMGGELFDIFADKTEEADKVLGYSIKTLCLEDPNRDLDKTQFTQPALYVVGALGYYQKLSENAEKPQFLVGHSLGEYNALLAADCFDFVTGLRLVKKRGELMSQASGGGMAAILGMSKEEIEAFLAKHGLHGIDLANYNTSSQIVISGLSADIEAASLAFQEEGRMCIPLNTQGAFHSRYMEESRRKYSQFVENIQFSDLKIPVVSNVDALPYNNAKIKDNLVNQITASVRWEESICYLLRQGVVEFEELGSGNILTKMVETIQKENSELSNVAGGQVASVHADKVTGNDHAPDSGAFAKNVGETEIAYNTEDVEGSSSWLIESKNMTAFEKVSQWNRKYPIGTSVSSSLFPGEKFRTKTEASILFGHRAAVYMEGFGGYFDLSELIPD